MAKVRYSTKVEPHGIVVRRSDDGTTLVFDRRFDRREAIALAKIAPAWSWG